MKKLFFLMFVLPAIGGCSSMSERIISEADSKTAGCAVESKVTKVDIRMPFMEKKIVI
jgi:hypothetical protein